MSIFNNFTPTSTKAITNQNYLNQSYVAALGESDGAFLKPDVDSQTVMRYGDSKMLGLTSLSEALDNINIKGNSTFEHAESERIRTPLFVDAEAAGAADADITYTLRDESQAFLSSAVQPYGQVSQPAGYPNTSGANQTPTNAVRVRDILEFPNGTKAIVTDVNESAGTFTAYPTKDGGNLPAIANDEKIIITGNAQPEGGNSNKSRNTRLLNYKNTIQTFRDTHVITGTGASSVGWVEVPGRDINGAEKTGYMWYIKGVGDTYTNHCNDIEMTLLTGERITNTSALNALGDDTSSTEGAIPQIEAFGNTEGYTNLDYEDLENMTRKFNTERGSHDNHIWGGFDFIADLNTAMREDANLQSGGIEYARYGDAARINNFGFSGFQVNDYKFSYSTMDIFSDPTALGSEDHKYRGIGLVMPIGNTVSYDSRGAQIDVPSWRINTMSEGGEGGFLRYKKDWAHGSVLGQRTNGEDKVKVEFLTDAGLEMFALNRYGLFLKE